MTGKHFDQYMRLIDMLYRYECKLYGVKCAGDQYDKRLCELVDLFRDSKSALS